MKYLPISSTERDANAGATCMDRSAIIAVARRMHLQAAMVIIDGIALAAVAIALGHVFAGVRVARPTRRGLIERFGEYGASRSWVSPASASPWNGVREDSRCIRHPPSNGGYGTSY
jgi:hypothetical protein